MNNLETAIREAKKFARTEGGDWCVVERRDPEGDLFEYAVSPSSVGCDEHEAIVWPTNAR